MAGSNTSQNPNKAKALEFKEKGNEHWKAGKFEAAEQFYSKAIALDPSNSIFYTNHSKALLKLTRYTEAISSSRTAISISPDNKAQIMKAYFNIAQAYDSLREYNSALEAVDMAKGACVAEKTNMKSLPSILELGLSCRKQRWEEQETRRLRERPGLLGEMTGLLGKEKGEVLGKLRASGANDVELERERLQWVKKEEELERVFRLVETMGKEGRRREMPDWAVDGISFNVMTDPVMTKTGQSYERTSILQHLERSHTDPLTREPLRADELRPNLGLKYAVEEFLEENGWAVDW